MEGPPPFSAPVKKKNTGLIIALVIGGIALCCIGPMLLVAGGGFFFFNKGKDLIACGQSIGFMRAAVIDYAKANGGKLPQADKWVDQVRPYYKKRVSNLKDEQKMFGAASAEGDWGCSAEGTRTGIAFNTALSGKTLASITDKSTVLLFETTSTGANLNQLFKPLPENTSPKIMGNPRGWFTAPLEGKIKAGKGTFSSEGGNVTFEVDEK